MKLNELIVEEFENEFPCVILINKTLCELKLLGENFIKFDFLIPFGDQVCS